MQFLRLLLALVGLVALAAAGSVHFVNQDSTARTIVFTPNDGYAAIDDLAIAGDATVVQTFPTGWVGNWYAMTEGAPRQPGMLGEVRFDGYASATYFDVSAIVNPSDDNGVKMIFPLLSPAPVSGCQTFPCDNAYNKWDDIATLSTDDADLVCLLGTLPAQRKRGLVARMSRDVLAI